MAAPPAETNQLEKPAFDLESQPAVVNSLVVTNLVVDLVVPEEERDDERIEEGGRLAIVAFDRLVAEPMEGRVDIERLRVANPLGFANPHLVTMDHFVVDVDLETIDADTLYVEEIAIQRPRVAYERKIKTVASLTVSSSDRGGRQDFRGITSPIEMLDEFRYTKIKSCRSTNTPCLVSRRPSRS